MLQMGGPGFASPPSASTSQKDAPTPRLLWGICSPSPGILKDLGYKPTSPPQGQPQELAGESLPRGFSPEAPGSTDKTGGLGDLQRLVRWWVRASQFGAGGCCPHQTASSRGLEKNIYLRITRNGEGQVLQSHFKQGWDCPGVLDFSFS